MAGGGDLGGGLGGAVGGLIGAFTSGNGGEDELKKALKVWEKLKTSDFDYRELSPPELRVVREMMPEVYDAVVPPEAQKIIERPETRQSQLASLGTLEQFRDQGDTLEDRLATREANVKILSAAGAAQEGTLRNLAARGQLGAGDELQARIAANQGAENLAADLGAQQARDRAMRRLGAATSAAQLAGNIRSQDVETQKANADYMERYNEILSRLRTQAAADAAGARERARGYNVGTAQDIDTANRQGKYNVSLENLNRKNRLKGDLFQQEATKASGMSNALAGLAQARYAEQAARRQNAQAIGSGVGQAAGSFI